MIRVAISPRLAAINLSNGRAGNDLLSPGVQPVDDDRPRTVGREASAFAVVLLMYDELALVTSDRMAVVDTNRWCCCCNV